MKTKSGVQRRHLPSSPFNTKPERRVEEFAVTNRVTHDKYGLGQIVAQEADAVTVDFGSHRLRVASPFDKLTKL